MQDINSLSQIFDLIVVDKSEGKLNFSNTIKKGKSFEVKNEYVEYKLSLTQNDKLFDNVLIDLTNFKKLRKVKLKFFKRNFLEKIFFKRNYVNLLKKIKSISENYSWLIIPKKYLYIIKQFDSYSENQNGHNSILNCIGKFDNLNLYLNADINSDKIYFGNYNSATILVRIDNSTIEYFLIETGETTELQII